MRGIFFPILVLLISTAAAAEPAGSSRRPAAPRNAEADAATYDRCLKLAKQNPGAAQSLAQAWHERGGAHPADHCAAVALFGLKRYKEAATRLEVLAQAMATAPAGLRADVFDQAGQAGCSPATRCGLMPPRVKPWSCNRMIRSCSSIARRPPHRPGISTRPSPISTMS